MPAVSTRLVVHHSCPRSHGLGIMAANRTSWSAAVASATLGAQKPAIDCATTTKSHSGRPSSASTPPTPVKLDGTVAAQLGPQWEVGAVERLPGLADDIEVYAIGRIQSDRTERS